MKVSGFNKTSLYDVMMAQAEMENNSITREELGEIVRGGNRSEIEEAVAKMEEAGGYENLE